MINGGWLHGVGMIPAPLPTDKCFIKYPTFMVVVVDSIFVTVRGRAPALFKEKLLLIIKYIKTDIE